MTSHDIGRHLRCYGANTIVSPSLDSLAAGGVRFELAFATAPQCSPSRATLATGCYPHSNGVMGLAHRGFDWELDPRTPHAAAIFAGLGFETHLFGSQHVSLHPERLGFAHMHRPGHDHGNASGQAIAEAVEHLLEGDSRQRQLFVEINFEDTHRPYPEVAVKPPHADAIDIPRYVPAGPEASAEFAGFQSAITQMDAAAGRVLAALEAAGRSENALLVFTTDHGLAMPRAKCTLYDPGLEVALILRWPQGGIDAGAARPELISNLDVLPTLLDACDAALPVGMQGRSFLPLLRGGTYEPGQAIFAEKTFHSYYDPMRCVRTRRHKYIRNFEIGFAVEVPGDIQRGAIFRADPSRYSTDRPSVVELYDLDADPLEQHNLAGTHGAGAVERELGAELWRWMRETDDPLLKGPIASPRYRLAMET
jgi:arylsulfatase A-like enzyme